ncbi:unnamed protein product, partial [Brenthis ino]
MCSSAERRLVCFNVSSECDVNFVHCRIVCSLESRLVCRRRDAATDRHAQAPAGAGARGPEAGGPGSGAGGQGSRQCGTQITLHSLPKSTNLTMYTSCSRLTRAHTDAAEATGRLPSVES